MLRFGAIAGESIVLAFQRRVVPAEYVAEWLDTGMAAPVPRTLGEFIRQVDA
jgi:hypothetical protein